MVAESEYGALFSSLANWESIARTERSSSPQHQHPPTWTFRKGTRRREQGAERRGGGG